MNDFTYEELRLILALYYFDNNKIDDKILNDFTLKLSGIFSKHINVQNVYYVISIFKKINPLFNYLLDKEKYNEKFYDLWEYYITNDRLNDLKKIYDDFKKGKYISTIVMDYNNIQDNELSKFINNHFENFVFTYNGDYIKPLYDKESNYGNTCYRDNNVCFNAIQLSNFSCEFSESHTSFIRKKGNVRYTEGHHLIPMKYQIFFDINIDVEANIVSLCSECHNFLHYGKNYEQILIKLYNERKDRLKKCGINISINDLLEMYE